MLTFKPSVDEATNEPALYQPKSGSVVKYTCAESVTGLLNDIPIPMTFVLVPAGTTIGGSMTGGGMTGGTTIGGSMTGGGMTGGTTIGGSMIGEFYGDQGFPFLF